jgi:hypothetical protein
MLLALLYFFYVRSYVADTFIVSDEYLVIGFYLAAFTGYFIVKAIVHSIAAITFFGGKKNRQLTHTSLFLTTMEGFFLYPAILLLGYLNVAHQTIIYYVLTVVFLVKLLSFYKCYVIFFRQNGIFLQIILYFCALEIVPLAALWGGLEVMTNALKINF